MRKKKNIVNNKGILGNGTDYDFYRMDIKEKAIVCIISFAGGCAAFSIFFGVSLIAAAFGVLAMIFMLPSGNKYFLKKRNKRLLIQFRDFLESVSSSLSSGQNISGAIKSAGSDMAQQYGENSMMAREIEIMVKGIANNYTAEEMLLDFAKRSHQRDIMSFAETFQVCNRTGGNMKTAIHAAYKILSDKMKIQDEIETTASKGKNDLLIMVCMPFLIMPMLGSLGGDITANTGTNIIVKAAGAIMIAAAYIIGRKLTDIRV